MQGKYSYDDIILKTEKPFNEGGPDPEKEDEVKEYIINNLNHTITIFNVTGGFSEKKGKVILTVIPSREYYYMTEGIKKIDEKAFFVVTDAYQVEGAK